MATVQHSTLTNGDLHEPKGIAAATPNSTYVANGSGSGDWVAKPFASIWYNSPVGLTLTTPTTFTLANPATTLTNQKDFTSNGAGRLTYTGSRTTDFQINMMLSGTAVTSTTIDGTIFLNSSVPPVLLVSSAYTNGANHQWHCSIPMQLELSTNDYIEIYVQASSGDLLIENLSLTVQGLI